MNEKDVTDSPERAARDSQHGLISRQWRVVAGSFAIAWGIIAIACQIAGKNNDFQFSLAVIHVVWWRMETNWAANDKLTP